MQVKIKKLDNNAIIPMYATEGAACFDLNNALETDVALGSNETVIFPTGLAFEIPEGYVMAIFSRSGHGFKNNTRLSNCVGIIDSDYRGEVKVKLVNDGPYDHTFEEQNNPLVISPKDRIAQAMIIPVVQVEFLEMSDLSETVRGTGGFGSTGA